MTEQKMMHAGIEIMVTANGKFYCRLNGTKVERTTMSAIKKEIDKKIPFQPFIGLSEDGTEIKIVALVHNGRMKHRTSTYFEEDTDTRGHGWRRYRHQHSEVIENTPENKKRIKAAATLQAKQDSFVSKIEKEIEAIQESFTKVNAEEMYYHNQKQGE